MKCINLVKLPLFIMLLVSLVVGMGTIRDSAAAENKAWVIGVANYPDIDEWSVAVYTSMKWYAEDHNIILKRVTGGGQFTGEMQLKNAKQLLEIGGIDGLILQPTSPATAAGIVDLANEKGIPVIGYEYPTFSSGLLLHVGVSLYEMGQTAGEATRKMLIEKFGKPQGTVLVLEGNPSNAAEHTRAVAFKAVFKDDPDVIIKSIVTPIISIEKATIAVGAWLAAGKDLDAAWGATPGLILGIVEALRKHGVDPSTKILVANDGEFLILDYIRQGVIKATTDQPVPFYGPIALKYMIDHLEGRPIPKVGSTITYGDGPNQLDIKGNKHLGIDPWDKDEESILPAAIVDWATVAQLQTEETGFTFPWFKTGVPLITKENVDSSAWWGNLPIDWASAIRSE